MKKRGLGKGLSELGVDELLTSSAQTHKQPEQGLVTLPLSALQPGRYQPRKHMNNESLAELAESIRSEGIIQPIIVRPVVGGGYEIIAGERRWRAAQLAELEMVPVVIRDINDESALAVSLIENIQRQDLNAMEEAEALQRLLDEFQMTHQEVATAVGKSRTSVTNTLRLLKLHTEVKKLVEQGDLDMGHARALLAVQTDKQLTLAKTIVERSLSVRETEVLIKKAHENKPEKPEKTPVSTEVLKLEENLAERLHTKVAIKQNNKGRGKVIIQFKNTDQLNKILEHIQ